MGFFAFRIYSRWRSIPLHICSLESMHRNQKTYYSRIGPFWWINVFEKCSTNDRKKNSKNKSKFLHHLRSWRKMFSFDFSATTSQYEMPEYICVAAHHRLIKSFWTHRALVESQHQKKNGIIKINMICMRKDGERPRRRISFEFNVIVRFLSTEDESTVWRCLLALS